jgi:hypothetical protein
MKLEFSRQFSKNHQISNLMEIRQVGAEFFHADGQTVMTKLVLAFRNFANALKNKNNYMLKNYCDQTNLFRA